MRVAYLQECKEYRPALYNALLLSGKLNSYLISIDQQAQEMMDTIIQQMVEAQKINEMLKTTDPMKWVGLMNNCKAQVEEIIFSDLIYV